MNPPTRSNHPSTDERYRVPGARGIKPSGGPSELGCRDPRLPFVLDPEGADLRTLGLGGVELRRSGMEYADEPDWFTRFDAEGNDVLDLEIDCVSDLDAVAQPFLHQLERGPLHPEHLSDQGCERLHRSALLPAEDGGELRQLLVARLLLDEQSKLPVALGHDLGGVSDRGDLDAADVRSLDLALLDVEDEGDAAVVVRGAVVERHVARAHQVARARFEVAPLQAPRHRTPPSLAVPGVSHGSLAESRAILTSLDLRVVSARGIGNASETAAASRADPNRAHRRALRTRRRRLGD